MNLCQKEQLNLLRHLLCIENMIFESSKVLANGNPLWSYDDQERYLKMAIRIDSTDPMILNRKKEYILKSFNSKRPYKINYLVQ